MSDEAYLSALLTEAERRERERRQTRWVPHKPTPKQCEFIELDCLEALFGGAAGGGKSDALLMDPLGFVDTPGYAALLLRRTFADLALAGALMDRAAEWLMPTAASWNDRDKTWTFPSGATLTFGYLETENDKYRYQSAEFQFIGFDELTQFTESQYTYMFSRLRRTKGHLGAVPLKMRSATNPGGVGNQWVAKRFGIAKDGAQDPGVSRVRPFVPSKLEDNPHIDREAYEDALSRLDQVTRDQLRKGLWVVDRSGLVYRYTEANLIERLPAGVEEGMLYVLAIDPGASLTSPSSAFCVTGWHPKVPHGVWTIEAWAEAGLTPSDYGERIEETTKRYGALEAVVMDEGALGKGYGEELRRRWGLGVEAAKKQHKRAFQKLLNGALEKQHVLILAPQCEALLDQMDRVFLDDRGLNELPRQENHLCDAHLYGWRKCYSWAGEAPESRPDPGTPEYDQQQAERELEEERAALQRKRALPWWQRR